LLFQNPLSKNEQSHCLKKYQEKGFGKKVVYGENVFRPKISPIIIAQTLPITPILGIKIRPEIIATSRFKKAKGIKTFILVEFWMTLPARLLTKRKIIDAYKSKNRCCLKVT